MKKAAIGRRMSTKPTYDHTEVLELPTGPVLFGLVEVAPEDIKSKTRVSEYNPRRNEFLSEYSLRDILPDLRDVGQTKAAYAHPVTEDGIEYFDMLDGSRRREGQHILASTFKVLVAERELTPEEARYVVKTFTRHSKPLSLLELGADIISHKSAHEQRKDEEGNPLPPLTQDELVVIFDKSKPIINVAVRAAENLPHDLLQAYPDLNLLGRPRLQLLLTLWERLDDAERERVVTTANKWSSKTMAELDEYGTPDQVTQCITKELLEQAPADSKPNNKAFKELVPNRASFRVADGQTELKVANLSAEQRSKLLAYVEKLVSD
ncbi:hypothetical protein IC617_08395 [Neiella sp. HB171785]|uniref:ParB-like N-terminal domain-containing protein n=1 Tax=Neiella litorisoli TaxID=2771431 RepID=A0A8J6UEG2_9GAMM|nr:hypothetical protein [Neiella litorisoli]MBD1389444.1 hypothetical protein [Neiella litorisoli]